MKDEAKTKTQLIEELAELRQYVADLKASLVSPQMGAELSSRAQSVSHAEAERSAAMQETVNVMGQEVAECKRAEQALRQANLVVENSPAVLFRWQAAEGWPVVLVSENIRRFGYTAEELLTGKIPYTKIIHPNDLEHVAREVQEHSASRDDRFTQEYRIMTKDGQIRWIDDHTMIERDTEGNITHYQGIIIDITERVEAEQALRASEERYRTLLEMAPDAIAIHSEGEVKFLNPAGYQMFRIESQEQLIGKSIQEFVHPDHWEHTRDQMLHLLSMEKEVVYPAEDLYIRQDGSPIPVEVTAVRLMYQGKPSIQMIIRDISKRKQVEQALRVSEGRLRSLVKNSSDTITVLRADGTTSYQGPSLKRIFGYEPEEFVDINVFDYLHPDDVTMIQAAFVDLLQRPGAIERIEYRFRHLNGSWIYVEAVANNLLQDPSIQGVIVNARDITERKQAEEALHTSEERYRSIVENALIGIFTIDGAYRFIYMNDELCRLLGYAREEMLGVDFRELLADESRKLVADRYIRRQRGEQVPSRYELRVVRKDGEIRHVEMSVSIVKDSAGQPRSMGQLSDITDRKRAEADRETFIKELETKNAELERFTYTVSHDLKSPLVTVRGFLGFLEQDAMQGDMERIRADIRYIREATDTMHQLLNDLLELSRIGRSMNPPQELSFGDLAQEALELVAGQVAERGVHVTISSDLPAIYGDRLRLLEVLQNLIDNAIKFLGDQPEPQIDIGAKPGADGSVLYVADNGIGIDPRYHDKVFGLFERLDPEIEGTGVGLALVKRIIEVHGGRIWVESDGLGHGSTFYFTLGESCQIVKT